MSIGIATERPWFAHYDPGVPHTLDYPAVPLQWLLADTAARHPQAVATIFGAVVAAGSSKHCSRTRSLTGSLTASPPGSSRLEFARAIVSPCALVRSGSSVALVALLRHLDRDRRRR